MTGIRTVLGPIAGTDLGLTLAAEPLLCEPPAAFEKADLPASDVAFALQAVDLQHLGRLSLGSFNLADLHVDEGVAEDALRRFAERGGGAAIVPASSRSVATAEQLMRLSRATGVHLIRGSHDLDELRNPQHTVGVLGAFPVPVTASPATDSTGAADDTDPATRRRSTIEAAARAAVETELALALDAAGASLDDVEGALQLVDAAGLDRGRVLLTGATSLIADRVGVDEGKRAALIDLGVVCALDDLGRLPTVRTVVSDHDVALTVLAFAAAGAGDRVVLSSGISQCHRHTAFGGNGLEFIPQEFLPYLRMFGADDALIAAVSGGTLADLLSADGRAVSSHEEASA